MANIRELRSNLLPYMPYIPIWFKKKLANSYKYLIALCLFLIYQDYKKMHQSAI